MSKCVMALDAGTTSNRCILKVTPNCKIVPCLLALCNKECYNIKCELSGK